MWKKVIYITRVFIPLFNLNIPLTVKAFSSKSAETALRYGTIGSAVLFVILSYFLIDLMAVSTGVWIAVLVGSVGGIVVGLVTEYYTGGRPVEKIAKDGETGSATVMISGLSVGMQSVVLPLFVILILVILSI